MTVNPNATLKQEIRILKNTRIKKSFIWNIFQKKKNNELRSRNNNKNKKRNKNTRLQE